MKQHLILVIDDSVVVLKTLSLKLQSRGYRVVTAGDSSSALGVARREKPDLIILDVNFPRDSWGEAWDGFDLMAWFRRAEETKNIPIVVISGSNSENYDRRCREAGAIGFFLKPIDYELLVATLRKALGQPTEDQAGVPLCVPKPDEECAPPLERPEQILIVEDDATLGEAIQIFLEHEGFQVTRVTDPASGLEQVEQNEYHIILTDMVMPGMTGDQFYQKVTQVKSRLGRRFIFMTGHQADPRSDLFIRHIRALMLWKPFAFSDLLTAISVVWKKVQAATSPSGSADQVGSTLLLKG